MVEPKQGWIAIAWAVGGQGEVGGVLVSGEVARLCYTCHHLPTSVSSIGSPLEV